MRIIETVPLCYQCSCDVPDFVEAIAFFGTVVRKASLVGKDAKKIFSFLAPDCDVPKRLSSIEHLKDIRVRSREAIGNVQLPDRMRDSYIAVETNYSDRRAKKTPRSRPESVW